MTKKNVFTEIELTESGNIADYRADFQSPQFKEKYGDIISISWDHDYQRIDIQCARLETDQEYQERLIRENIAKVAEEEKQRTKRRKEYEKAKALVRQYETENGISESLGEILSRTCIEESEKLSSYIIDKKVKND